MSKKIKEMELNALRSAFKGVKDMILVETVKLDSGTDYELRKKLREKKMRAKLVKNTLAKKVFTENDLHVRHFMRAQSKRLIRKGQFRAA